MKTPVVISLLCQMHMLTANWTVTVNIKLGEHPNNTYSWFEDDNGDTVIDYSFGTHNPYQTVKLIAL